MPSLKNFLFFLVTFFFMNPSLRALPEGAMTVSGETSIKSNDKAMTIIASDKAILTYSKFNIAEGEKVQFVQPNHSSCVLNRVSGKESSAILGQMSANGKVFLVNPNGVYFGPNAVINTGSLIVSTLGISDTDFLDGKYRFNLQPGDEKSQIQNFGRLESPEGAIILLAPRILNEGMIVAKAGRILCASAERVTLDFVGDGLFTFEVDGEVLDGIENRGTINADGGEIYLRAKKARELIRQTLNSDGVVAADSIVERDGELVLVHSSKIEAKTIDIEANNISLAGTIHSEEDTSISAQGVLQIRDSEQIPLVFECGRDLRLSGDKVDIMTLNHPGTTLVSGRDMKIISPNEIFFDAHAFSGGGFAFVHPDGKPAMTRAFFDPIITSNSGVTSIGTYSGPSLMVQATGQIIIQAGSIINITSADATITGSTPDEIILKNSPSLILRAGTPSPDVIFPQTWYGMTFNSAVAVTSQIILQGVTINVDSSGVGGPVILSAPPIGGISLTTAASSITTLGNSPAVTNEINITGAISGTFPLTLNAGNGSITVTGGIGVSPAPPLASLTMTANGSNGITLAGNIGTAGVAGVSGITTLTAPNGDINFNGSNYNANTQIYTTGATKKFQMNNVAATSFISSADPITFATGTVNIAAAPSLTVTTTGGAISLANIEGNAKPLTLNATAGDIQVGQIGTSGAPLGSLSVTGNNISFNGNLFATQFGTLAGATGNINLSGDMTLSLGTLLTFNKPTILKNNISLTNPGGFTFTSTLNSDTTTRNLAINSSGGAGNVTFTGIVGGVAKTGALSATTAGGNISTAAALTTDSLSFTTGSGGITIGGAVSAQGTTTAGNVSMTTTTGTVTANAAIATTAGSNVTVTNGGLFTTAAAADMTLTGSFTQNGAGAVNASGDILTTAFPISFSRPITLGGAVLLDTTNAGAFPLGQNITLANTINGAFGLTLRAGTTGAVTLGNTVGGTTALTALTVSSSGSISAKNLGTASTALGAITLNSSGTITFADSFYRTTGAQSYTASAFQTQATGGLTFQATTAASTISFSPVDFTLAEGNDLNIQTNAGAITLGNVYRAPLSTTKRSLTLNTGGLAIVARVGNVGTALGQFNLVNMLAAPTFAGDVYSDQINMTSVGGTVLLGGSLYTNDQPLNFPVAVTRNNVPSVTVSTKGIATGLGNNVTFASTINGDVTGRNLAVDAGSSGTVTFNGIVGGAVRPNNLTVKAGSIVAPLAISTSGDILFSNSPSGPTSTPIDIRANVNTTDGMIYFDGPLLRSTGISVISTGGTSSKPITITGNITNSLAGLSLDINAGNSLSGGVVTIGGSIAATGVPFTNISLTGKEISLAGNIGTPSADGASGIITLTAADKITLSGTNYRGNAQNYLAAMRLNVNSNATTSFLSSGDVINFSPAVPMELIGTTNVVINTTLATPTGASVTLGSISGSAGRSATINAGTAGNIIIGGVGTSQGDFTSVSLTGAILTLNGAITSNTISLNPLTQINLRGNLTSFNTPITFSRPVVRDVNSDVQVSTNGGDITFAAPATLNGPNGISFNPSGGTLIFNATIGGNDPLAYLTAANAGNLTVNNIGGINPGVTGATSLSATGAINFNGTNYRANAQSYTAGTDFNMTQAATNFYSTNDPITFSNGTVRLNLPAASLAIASTNGAITVGAVRGVGNNTLSMQGGTGTVQVGQVGQTLGEFNTVALAGGDVRTVGDLYANSFTFTPTGTFYLGGGISSNNTALNFSRPVIRNNALNSTLSTGPIGANITFANTIDGDGQARNLSLAAGTGVINFVGAIGTNNPLNTLSASASAMTVNNIGTATRTGVSNGLALTATSGDLTFPGTIYSANGQTYTVGSSRFFDYTSPTGVSVISQGAPIIYNGGKIRLATGTDLTMNSNNGNISFVEILGTTAEDVTLRGGTGLISMGKVSSNIRHLNVTGGDIRLGNEINANTVTMTSNHSILNQTATAYAITTTGDASFNALSGTVGSLSSPLLVHSGGLIFAGSPTLGDFNGSSSDNTVHVIASNPPRLLIFNGVILRDVPDVVQSFASAYVAGIYSIYYNLSSGIYFYPDHINCCYLRERDAPIYIERF